ncbi:hypothetical protein [Acanthopleuribacter pedis]|uniref:Uncharacterized protein n=1 Tax=Acanthopleuribacter pedis TaxID=442870 RepID=A0A8J7QFF8_9BACT|nr:hypothetical protein [Acanthopleuribacter pedis]MBO1317648.1 hypothetical protein [Acanthopleuribacter pedis]
MHWFAKVVLLLFLSTVFWSVPWLGATLAGGLWVFQHALESRQRLWRRPVLQRLRRRLTLPEGAVAPREGPLRGHAILCSPECIEVRFQQPLPFRFHLSTRARGSSDWDALPLGDPAFDRRFSLTTEDAAAIAFFDVPMRRRLLGLGSFSMDEKGFYLYADAPLFAELTDIKTAGYFHRVAARFRFLFSNVAVHRLEQLVPIIAALAEEKPPAQCLAETILAETVPECGARQADFFVKAYPEALSLFAESPADEAPFFRAFLAALAGPEDQRAGALAACMPACPVVVAETLFQAIRALDPEDAVELCAMGLGTAVLAPQALALLDELRGVAARDTLLDYAALKPNETRTRPVLEALAAYDGDEKVCTFLVERVAGAGANHVTALEVLAKVGSRETLTLLSGMVKTRGLNRERLESTRYLLREKHGLLNDHGGLLSVAEATEGSGALSVAKQRGGELSLKEAGE